MKKTRRRKRKSLLCVDSLLCAEVVETERMPSGGKASRMEVLGLRSRSQVSNPEKYPKGSCCGKVPEQIN